LVLLLVIQWGAFRMMVFCATAFAQPVLLDRRTDTIAAR
jgi:hypothetical protein